MEAWYSTYCAGINWWVEWDGGVLAARLWLTDFQTAKYIPWCHQNNRGWKLPQLCVILFFNLLISFCLALFSVLSALLLNRLPHPSLPPHCHFRWTLRSFLLSVSSPTYLSLLFQAPVVEQSVISIIPLHVTDGVSTSGTALCIMTCYHCRAKTQRQGLHNGWDILPSFKYAL